MKKLAILLGMAAPLLLLGSCAQSAAHDDLYKLAAEGTGTIAAGVDAPVGFVAGTWTAPHEQKAEDISLADVPGFMFSAVDPYNVLPWPFGTFYVPWKMAVTTLKVFPFVTYSEEGEGAPMVFTSGAHGGPLWHVFGPAIEDMDSFVIPAGETTTSSHTPVPGNGDRMGYWRSRTTSIVKGFTHAGYTMKYAFLGANSDKPPYDNYFPDVMERDKTTIHYTFDTFLFNYDWDDPFID